MRGSSIRKKPTRNQSVDMTETFKELVDSMLQEQEGEGRGGTFGRTERCPLIFLFTPVHLHLCFNKLRVVTNHQVTNLLVT